MRNLRQASTLLGLAALLLAAGVEPAAAQRVRASSNRNVSGSRSTSVNRSSNVNVNRNTNVNVHRDVDVHVNNGCCYHPVARAAAVGAAVAVTAAVVGSIVYSLPPSCSTVIVNGLAYQQCGGTWYQPQISASSTTYVVVNAPQ